MTDDEINKIIAEFMWSDCDSWDYGFIDGDVVVNYDIGLKLKINYTKSLDALVPVMEKLGGGFNIFINHPSCRHYVEYLDEVTEKIKYIQKTRLHRMTIQQAAAHATALAIKELNEK